MYSTAHQATTRPSSHKEGKVSEGARKDYRPGHKTTLKFNAPYSDGCGQTTDVESESERSGFSSVRVLRSKSVPASDALPTSSRATVSRHCHLTSNDSDYYNTSASV